MAARPAKRRTPIPPATAARVQFEADRTCCVCRVGGKKIQVHHIDDNPSNNHPSNLAVLCLDCHGDTQLSGGFGRKLDAEQVTLYRDDWNQVVSRRRVKAFEESKDQLADEDDRITHITTMVEALREVGDYFTLVNIYDGLGNIQLRDKYIELALAEDPSDDLVCFLRGLQGRPDLIPAGVEKRALAINARKYGWAQRARTLKSLGRDVEAADDYIRDIRESFDEGRYFSAAYYLKEMVEAGLITALFERAMEEAAERGDLWWQYRSLQELGWNSERNQFLLDHATEIETGDNRDLKAALLSAQGRQDDARRLTLEALRPIDIEEADIDEAGVMEGDGAEPE